MRALPARNLVISAIELILALLAGALAASLVWTLIAGSYRTPVPSGGARSSVSSPGVQGRSVSGSAADLFGARLAPAARAVETLPESQLGFALFGVRTGAAPSSGSAIIEVGANGQRSFASGAELQTGVTLDEVYSDRVVLNRRGAREVIYLTERARARQQAQSVPLSAVTIAGIALSPQALASGGQGLRIDGDPGALSALGIQTGDILASIDGEPLSNALVTSLSARLADGDLPASLTLERDGARLTLQTRSNP